MSLDLVLAMPSVAYAERRYSLPDAPGLYFAIREEAEVVYVGISTKSIRGRWRATYHRGGVQIEKRGIEDQVRIAYLLYEDIGTLVDDEKAAIREFRPSFNYSHVPGAYERMLAEQRGRPRKPPPTP